MNVPTLRISMKMILGLVREGYLAYNGSRIRGATRYAREGIDESF